MYTAVRGCENGSAEDTVDTTEQQQTPRDSRTPREMRHLERTFKLLSSSESFHDYCGICCDTLTSSETVFAMTVCGHVFHGPCWSKYIQHKVDAMCLTAETLTPFAMASVVLLWEAGAKCPMCRTPRCLVDRFALHMADINSTYADFMRVGPDENLRIATCKHW